MSNELLLHIGNLPRTATPLSNLLMSQSRLPNLDSPLQTPHSRVPTLHSPLYTLQHQSTLHSPLFNLQSPLSTHLSTLSMSMESHHELATTQTPCWVLTPHARSLFVCSMHVSVWNSPRQTEIMMPTTGDLITSLTGTAYHSPLIAHCSLLTTHHSPLSAHGSLLTTHRSPLTTHHSANVGLRYT